VCWLAHTLLLHSHRDGNEYPKSIVGGEKIKIKPHKSADRRSLVVEQLEQRVLFSADTLPVFETAAADKPEPDALTNELYSGEKIGSSDSAPLPDDTSHGLALHARAYVKISDEFPSQDTDETSASSTHTISAIDEHLAQQESSPPKESASEESPTSELILPTPDVGDKGFNVVFVDSTIDDADALLEGITENYSDTDEWFVITIDSTVDGIADITESLEGVTDVDAIHIISHGDSNGFQLGSAQVNTDSQSVTVR